MPADDTATTCHGIQCARRDECALYVGNRPPGSRSQIGDCVPDDQPLGRRYPLFQPLNQPKPQEPAP
jgi:hypothetical protein